MAEEPTVSLPALLVDPKTLEKAKAIPHYYLSFQRNPYIYIYIKKRKINVSFSNRTCNNGARNDVQVAVLKLRA